VRWKSLADLEAHLNSPHITALLGEFKELLAAPPDGPRRGIGQKRNS
jgi:quinol monooxygenase YgiN